MSTSGKAGTIATAATKAALERCAAVPLAAGALTDDVTTRVGVDGAGSVTVA